MLTAANAVLATTAATYLVGPFFGECNVPTVVIQLLGLTLIGKLTIIQVIIIIIIFLGVVAERIRAPNSCSSVSVQQSVGPSPGRDNGVPE